MCVDLTDLNKACPKDSFPLPRIDTLVDSMSNHQTLVYRLFLGIQSDKHIRARLGKNGLHHQFWALLLLGYALRFEECGRNLPKAHQRDV